MPNVYLTNAQLERVAQLLDQEAENGDDLAAGESRELKDLAEDMIRKIGHGDDKDNVATS